MGGKVDKRQQWVSLNRGRELATPPTTGIKSQYFDEISCGGATVKMTQVEGG